MDTAVDTMADLSDLRAQIEAVPTGTSFSREAVLEMLAKVSTNGGPELSQEPQEGPPAPWPERLWIDYGGATTRPVNRLVK